MASELETLLIIKGKPYKGIIDDWRTDDYWGIGIMVVRGMLHDKPGRESGVVTDIRTSEIVEIYKDYNILETQNSYYKLGLEYNLDG